MVNDHQNSERIKYHGSRDYYIDMFTDWMTRNGIGHLISNILLIPVCSTVFLYNFENNMRRYLVRVLKSVQ